MKKIPKIEDCIDQPVSIHFRRSNKLTGGICRGILQKEDNYYKVRSKDGSYLRFLVDEPCVYNEEFNAELAINMFELGEKL